MKQAKVYFQEKMAGILTENDSGFIFQYDPEYLQLPDSEAISLTLPLIKKEYHDKVLFPVLMKK